MSLNICFKGLFVKFAQNLNTSLNYYGRYHYWQNITDHWTCG